MKQTAVEWLEKNISKYISYHYDKAYEENDEVTKIFEQAKKMEKKQMIDFAFAFSKDYTTAKEMRDYYKETFNTNDK
jgi:hemoglobin-like flavoprotein